MAEEKNGFFKILGVVVTGVAACFTIAQICLAIYDRAQKPEVEVSAEIYAVPYVTPAGFALQGLNRDHFVNEAVSEGVGKVDELLGQVTRSNSLTTIVVRNTGALPAEGVTLDINNGFTIVSAEYSSGRTEAWENPRAITLPTIRAGQSTVIRAWSPMPWSELSPTSLLEEVRVTHNSGIAPLKLARGRWADKVDYEQKPIRKNPWVVIFSVVSGLIASWSALYFQTHHRARMLKKLLNSHRPDAIDGGGP